MSNWNDVVFSNGYVFEGDFQRTHKKGENPIEAYTFSPGHQWLSDDATATANLAFETERAGKRKLDLWIQVKPLEWGGLAREIREQKNLRTAKDHKNPRFSDHLTIYIYKNKNESAAAYRVIVRNVVFKPEKREFKIPFKRNPITMTLPYVIYPITYDKLEVLTGD